MKLEAGTTGLDRGSCGKKWAIAILAVRFPAIPRSTVREFAKLGYNLFYFISYFVFSQDNYKFILLVSLLHHSVIYGS